jgi:hypothetical protein
MFSPVKIPALRSNGETVLERREYQVEVVQVRVLNVHSLEFP